MNRKYTIEDYLEKVEWIKTIKDVVLTTDLIVGFPSETEKEYLETVDLIKNVRFHEAFMYQFNPREGTSACKLSGQLSSEEKVRRLSYIIELQNGIKRGLLSEQIGKKTSVLIESVSKKNKTELTGRTFNGIMIFIEGNKEKLGTIVDVEIQSVSGNGIKGIILDK